MAVRTLMLEQHMEDLKDRTHLTHYERYRATKLRGMMQKMVIKDHQIIATIVFLINHRHLINKSRKSTKINIKSRNRAK